MFIDKNGFTARTVLGGFTPLYYKETVNHCPSCSRTHWHIGRSTAECAFCGAALPLAATDSQPMRPLFFSRCSQTAHAA